MDATFGCEDNHTKYEPKTPRWRPGTGVASAGHPFQNPQFRAKISHSFAQNRQWPKLLNMGSKCAHSTCLCTPNSPKVSFEKHIFHPFLIEFWSQNGLQWADFTCLGTPNGLRLFLEKHISDPILTHFSSHSSPFSRHFGMLGGPKQATTSSKRAINLCLGIPCGPGPRPSWLRQAARGSPRMWVPKWVNQVHRVPTSNCF